MQINEKNWNMLSFHLNTSYQLWCANIFVLCNVFYFYVGYFSIDIRQTQAHPIYKEINTSEKTRLNLFERLITSKNYDMNFFREFRLIDSLYFEI